MNEQSGIVVKIDPNRGFGFLSRANDKDIFFHCTQLAGGLEFSERLLGQRVTFLIEGSDRGPRATNVRPANP